MYQRPSTPVDDVDMYGMGANTTVFAIPATPQGAPTPKGPLTKLTPIRARSLHTPDIHDDNDDDGAISERDFSSVTPPIPQASVGMRLRPKQPIDFRPSLSHGHISKHDAPPQPAGYIYLWCSEAQRIPTLFRRRCSCYLPSWSHLDPTQHDSRHRISETPELIQQQCSSWYQEKIA
jgi:hypothetical protein